MKRVSLVFGRGLTFFLTSVLLVSCANWERGGYAPRGNKSAGITRNQTQYRTRARTPTRLQTQASTRNIPANRPSTRKIQPYEGLTVYPDRHILEIKAHVCLDEGWLEQIACSPGTRDHESLMTIKAKPSEVHTALLLAGFKPGKPGKWIYEEDRYQTVPPQGHAVMVFVRFQNEDEKTIEVPIGNWISDHQGNHEFPEIPWVFGGSRFVANPEGMEPGEYYIADYSGSIIGLVTFGDEVLGFAQVISDQEVVSPPEWVVNEDAIPDIGTAVTIVIRPMKRPEIRAAGGEN